MSLTPGTRLGPYEIVAPLGAGGMGEVYKAKDTRLDRVVAIKVLAPHIAERQDVRQRFEREARTVATLNHPHICVLHDIGRQDPSTGSGPAIHFLVMEHLEGESLQARLARGPLSLDQALRHAAEIADALEKAHRQGVTHRDLKPANIMLTKAGAKLLDFGLAKTAGTEDRRAESARSSLETCEAAPRNDLTAEGTILGTVQYMAPEQLEGRGADSRTDIFALGSCIYEMLTGRKAFEGKSQASVMSAIMSSEPPPLALLQPMTPKALDRVVTNCLAKDPDERWQTAHDVLLQLRAIREASGQADAAAATAARPRSRERLAWLVVSGVLIAVIAAQWMRSQPVSSPQTPVRLSILPPAKTDFGGGQTLYDPLPSWPVISPDGTRLALVLTGPDGQTSLWIRPIDAVTAQPIAGTEDARFPFWSPDGRALGFFANGKLKKVGVSGGTVQSLCDASSGGGTWSREGVILFSVDDTSGLKRVSANGGECAVLTSPGAGELYHASPEFLPDGRHYLYTAVTPERHNGGYFGVYLASLDSAGASLLLPTARRAVFAPPGYLLFDSNQALMAQPFDSRRLELAAQPQPIADLIGSENQGFTASENGIVAYREGSAFSTHQLVWFDRAGRALSTLGAPAVYGNPRISPDGQRVAVAKQEGPNVDVWIMDVLRGTERRLTLESASGSHHLDHQLLRRHR